MSSRKQAAMRNSTIGLIGQVISLILQIISRKFFIQFIGEEILGLNNTFSAALQTLSLAEFGIQNAISYNLYRPLAEKKYEEIKDIVNVYKVIYRCIGIFFTLASIVMLPFLHLITKNVDITRDVCFYFLIQAASSTVTYFLAYKRTVLYADQKEYVYKIVDTVMNVVFKSAQILVIVRFHSYYCYIILQMIQSYASNVIVHVLCKKRYPFLEKTKFNKEYAKKIIHDAKDIFAGRFAGYVYSSTDSLIVSKILGTVRVTFLGNYTTITNNLKFLINSILYPLIPIVGNYLAENQSIEQQEKKMRVFNHLRYIIALGLAIPALVLIDGFISNWVGERFVLSSWTKVLLIADLYLCLIQGASNDYVIGHGLFKYDKYVTIIGVIINLSLSLTLVWKIGISGVLLGTVISQLFNWLGHTWIVYRYGFENNMKKYAMCILQNIFYMICFGITAALCEYAYSYINVNNSILKFLISGIACEIIVLICYFIFNIKCKESKELINMFLPILKDKLRKK